jgi:aspartate aminotransferase-like enzyme
VSAGDRSHDAGAHSRAPSVGAHSRAPLPQPFGRFFLPGPTDVHAEVLEAMVHPMFAHRGPEMRDMLQRMAGPLKQLFRTERPILMSTSSATGFMEAAVRGGVRERVLVVDGGFFGDRFARIAERSGKQVVRLPIPLGRTVEADELDQWLTKNPVDSVALVHCETSTCALAPLEELARVVNAREDVVLLVDAVTSIGGSPVETDAWGLDFVFTGTQKALAIPPGVALAAASPRMMERARRQAEPGWYFDLVLHEEAIQDHQPTQTPCIPLYLALETQLRRIDAEGGVEARWARHREMLRMMEEWVAAHPGWAFFAPEGRRAWTVSALKPPKGKTGRQVVAEVAGKGYTIGAGLDAMADAMVRIGHMGDLTPEHFAGLLSALEDGVDRPA